MILFTYTTCAYFLLTFFVFGLALVAFVGAFLVFLATAFLAGAFFSDDAFGFSSLAEEDVSTFWLSFNIFSASSL